MKHTPLFAQHLALGASMLNLKGVARPVEYCGHTREHMATRNGVTLCDASHMGELIFTGKDASSLLQKMIVSNVQKAPDGKALYSALCNEQGYIMDDLVLMRLADDRWLAVVNVTMIEQDYQWIIRNNTFADAVVTDVSASTALMALQGPYARETLQKITRKNLAEMEYYSVVETEISTLEGGLISCVVSRTGYTGEIGFEVCCARDLAPFIWTELMRAGRPFGIIGQGVAARESLRTESGLLLNGNDMDGQTTPYEAGLGWIIDLSVDFIGRDALVREKERGPSKKIVGIELDGLPTMRYGYPVFHDGARVGMVTSGPINRAIAGKSLGFAYVQPSLADPGQRLEVEILGERYSVTVVKLPFRARHTKDEPKVKTYSPFELQFCNEHVWIKKLGTYEYAVGLTEYAQSKLGEILYFKAPSNGDEFLADSPMAYLDSYRCVFPLTLPFPGTVNCINPEFVESPEQINCYPYCENGLFVVHAENVPILHAFEEYVCLVAERSAYAYWSTMKRSV